MGSNLKSYTFRNNVHSAMNVSLLESASKTVFEEMWFTFIYWLAVPVTMPNSLRNVDYSST